MTAKWQKEYDTLARLANVAEAGGLPKERSVLLLWFLRNGVGIDDLDAYEFVCDGDNDKGVDALTLEPSSGNDDHETLVIYQSEYTESPHKVGPNKVDRLLTVANHFRTHDALKSFVGSGLEARLLELIKRFELLPKLAAGAVENGTLRIRLVLLTSGLLNGDAEKLIRAAVKTEGPGYVDVWDIRRLGALAKAVDNPKIPDRTIKVPAPSAQKLIVGADKERVAILPVAAKEIVKWQGIDDRSLFELNVRRELPANNVRRQIDGAVKRQTDHPNFLAYHNGLTVICREFTHANGVLTVKAPAVVNGAQSVIAFKRGHDLRLLTDDLKVFVKFVEVSTKEQLAKEISKRSNTQNPVNARNLMSESGPQRRIAYEMETSFPEIFYEVKPDASAKLPSGVRRISNDDAAQLLCAALNAKPWLAVKRQALFESDNHAEIFNDKVHATDVVLVDAIGSAVDSQKDLFPAVYRQTWRLTRIVAVYLTAEAMRAAEAKDVRTPLSTPPANASETAALAAALEPFAKTAAVALSLRRDQRERDDLDDDFKVEFKNADELRELRDKARDFHLGQLTMARAIPAKKAPGRKAAAKKAGAGKKAP